MKSMNIMFYEGEKVKLSEESIASPGDYEVF